MPGGYHGFQCGMGYGRCFDGADGADQSSGDRDPVKPGYPLYAGLFPAEIPGKKSRFQGKGYWTENKNRLLE